MGGGLESGVIHNQSNEEVRYILHHKEWVSTSGIVKRGVNVYDINNNKMMEVRSMELRDHSYVDFFFTTTHIATRG